MKANKQGISLIVLVITIVVVIILAAAVILSLSNNNPIDNARIANLAETKDGIYSAVYTYTSSMQAKTQAFYSDEEIILGSGTDNDELQIKAPAGIVNTTAKKAVFADSTADKEVAKTVYAIDETKFEAAMGEALPTAPFSNSDWYVDAEGQIYLGVTDISKIPSYLGGVKGDDIDSITKTNVKDDVSLVKTLVEIKDIPST